MRIVLMALTWAVAWAPIGVVIGTIVDPRDAMDEPWVAVGVFPGFLCGAIFAALLGIANGHRRLADWPLSRAGAWGAVSGLLVGMLPFVSGTVNNELPLWVWGIIIIGSVTLLSSISAVGSAALARTTKPQKIF
jgi:hypothetical protein